MVVVLLHACLVIVDLCLALILGQLILQLLSYTSYIGVHL
jgi:hypothetical protein